MFKKIAYQRLLKPILFCFQPDLVHKVFVKIGHQISRFSALRWMLRTLYGSPDQFQCSLTVDGVHYQSPVLLAAGFDYNGHLSKVLWDIGFGGQEVGSVTAAPCTGNPPPNTTRLIQSQSIQVFKGLRNDGAETIIKRLQANPAPEKFVRGVSIAKTNSADCCTEEQGIADYCQSFRLLNQAGIGDFYTINISCPNAYGGEDFARESSLRKLTAALAQIPCQKPVYYKMPINLAWQELQPLIEVIHQSHAQGVVIGNLNKDYRALRYPQELKNNEYRGGLSGAPCRELSNELIGLTRQHYPQMTIIGCGGILSVEDALDKLKLGANLIQLISGMIFNGPHLINEINQKIKKIS